LYIWFPSYSLKRCLTRSVDEIRTRSPATELSSSGNWSLGFCRLATETCLNAIAGKVTVTAGQIDLGYETILRESTAKNS
jgi:hypothetical protein